MEHDTKSTKVETHNIKISVDELFRLISDRFGVDIPSSAIVSFVTENPGRFGIDPESDPVGVRIFWTDRKSIIPCQCQNGCKSSTCDKC